FMRRAMRTCQVSNLPVRRASTVLADYNALFQRSQLLQLQFNGALYLGSLLLLALAVIAAIVVADRIVRPLGTLIGATRTAAGGDLSVRVTPPARDDEPITASSWPMRQPSG
ncbi:HAMP domain-containing protein, partial [Sphingopyxis sp.]|uniref:HAMP domain-containing protein n=1 Tax=Sphingopyxis sp. TaxID=1908224 RepID=UPI0025F24DE9